MEIEQGFEEEEQQRKQVFWRVTQSAALGLRLKFRLKGSYVLTIVCMRIIGPLTQSLDVL